GEGHIDPAMHQAPPAAPQPELDHVRRESRPESLGTRNYTALIPGQKAEGRRKLTFHGAQCDGRYRHLADPLNIGVDSGFRVIFVHHSPPNSPASPNPPGKSRHLTPVRSTMRLGLALLEGSVLAREGRGGWD